MRSVPIPIPADLTDGVVVVRLRRPADVPLIAAAAEDPISRRWLDDTPHPDEPPADNVASTLESFSSGRAAPLLVADAASDDPVGLVNLQFRDDALATIAYSVFPAGRGRGVAARAVRLVQLWATRDLGLAELRLEIDPDNRSSLRVAEKLGWRELPASDAAEGKRIFTSSE